MILKLWASSYFLIFTQELVNQALLSAIWTRKPANAVAESFFHTLKTGLTNHKQYQTRDEAQEDIFDYIEVFYNRKRLHSTNDYWSPVDYEAMQKVV